MSEFKKEIKFEFYLGVWIGSTDGKSVELTKLILNEPIPTEIDLVLPEEIEGLPVISIGDKFADSSGWELQTSLRMLIIGKDVMMLGEECFKNCGRLSEVVFLGDEISVIKEGAFENCFVLGNINLPNINNGIGSRAFKGCTYLTKINLPEGLLKIEEETFCGSSLREIKIPSSVVEVGVGAFRRCYPLKNVNFKEAHSLTRIGEYSFYGCVALGELQCPENLIEMGEGAFAECINLTKVVFNDKLTEIPEEAFMGCGALKEVNFIYGIKIIGNSSFMRCRGLYTITLSSSVTEIGREAFSGCPNIKTIIMDNNNYFEGDAFFLATTQEEKFKYNERAIFVNEDAFYSRIMPEIVYMGEKSDVEETGSKFEDTANDLKGV